MNSSPFFSILIPTKNRPLLVKNAIQSVLRQEFKDFEVIIIDNNTDKNTQESIRSITDDRLVYYQTGNLSMSDNWQYALQQAHGQYLTLLTDRMILTDRYALSRIYYEIKRYNAQAISWAWGNLLPNHTIEALDTYTRSYALKSTDVIRAFAQGDWEWSNRKMPKGLNTCLKVDTLQDLQAKFGEVCIPVSPDYTLGFFTCFFIPSIVHIENTIAISYAYDFDTSNGYKTLYDYESYKAFFLSFADKLKQENIYDFTLLKLPTQANSLFYDLFHTAHITNTNMMWHDVNLVFYFLINYDQIKLFGNLPQTPMWLEEWHQKLSIQNGAVRRIVENQLEIRKEKEIVDNQKVIQVPPSYSLKEKIKNKIKYFLNRKPTLQSTKIDFEPQKHLLDIGKTFEEYEHRAEFEYKIDLVKQYWEDNNQ